MRRAIAFTIIGLLACWPAFAQDRPLQTTETREFLRLPESMQRLYVSGVLDGIYLALNANLDYTPKAWRDCIRRVSVSRTTDEVLTLLRSDEERQVAPVTRAVAAVIEARGCPR